MIITPARARLALGLMDAVTNVDRAIIQNLIPKIDAAIIRHLRYDPQYRVISDGEWYPRSEGGYTPGTGEVWEVTQSFAHLTPSERNDVLQLARLPVRTIEGIRVDWTGGFGQKPNTFGTNTAWTAGVDYWQEFTAPYLNMTGHVFANAGWPTEPGTVIVKYTAGFTRFELEGITDTTVADPQTGRVCSGFNASDIMQAAELTLVKYFKTMKVQAKQGRAGWLSGPLSSESLGKYSYSAGGGGGSDLTSMKVSLPSEARECLTNFVHYGLMV